MGSSNTKPVIRERSDSVWGSGDLKMMRSLDKLGVPTTPSPNIQYYAVVRGFNGLMKMDPKEIKEADEYLDYRCVSVASK